MPLVGMVSVSVRQRRKGLGDSMWAELLSGCLSDDVPCQPQETGQGEARRHAESVDTGGIEGRPVRHEEGGYKHEPRRLDDETSTWTKDHAAYANHGLRTRGAASGS